MARARVPRPASRNGGSGRGRPGRGRRRRAALRSRRTTVADPDMTGGIDEEVRGHAARAPSRRPGSRRGDIVLDETHGHVAGDPLWEPRASIRTKPPEATSSSSIAPRPVGDCSSASGWPGCFGRLGRFGWFGRPGWSRRAGRPGRSRRIGATDGATDGATEEPPGSRRGAAGPAPARRARQGRSERPACSGRPGWNKRRRARRARMPRRARPCRPVRAVHSAAPLPGLALGRDRRR